MNKSFSEVFLGHKEKILNGKKNFVNMKDKYDEKSWDLIKIFLHANEVGL